MAKAEQGRWITIGGHPSEDGKRQHVGGSPVYVVGNRIVKGAAALTGRSLDDMKAAPELGSHRQQLQSSREHERARWRAEARAAGVEPNDLDTLASQIIAHDKEHTEERKKLVQRARQKLQHFGYGPQSLTTNLRRSGEFHIPHIDQVAEELYTEFPGQFAGHERDLYDRVVDLLAEGNPQPMSTDEAYQQAFEHLQQHGPNASEVGNEPLFSDEPESDFGAWGGGPTQSQSHLQGKIDAAWERYLNREQHAHGGGLFGGEDMQSRSGFAKLPNHAPVLFVEGQYRGQTGKIVRDEQHGNRVVAEIDSHPEWGLVPVSPEAIEPLHANQSWRSEYASGPSEQHGLFGASAFLPKRGSDEDESVPFSRNTSDAMQTVWDRRSLQLLSRSERPQQYSRPIVQQSAWDRLTPRQIQRRADVVWQYARQMPAGDDMVNFHKADRLIGLLAFDPGVAGRAIAEARQNVQAGKISQSAAVEQLMNRLARDANGRDARLLATAFERALANNRPLAEAFASLTGDDDSAGNELVGGSAGTPLRNARDNPVLQHSRVVNRVGTLLGNSRDLSLAHASEVYNRAIVLMQR